MHRIYTFVFGANLLLSAQQKRQRRHSRSRYAVPNPIRQSKRCAFWVRAGPSGSVGDGYSKNIVLGGRMA